MAGGGASGGMGSQGMPQQPGMGNPYAAQNTQQPAQFGQKVNGIANNNMGGGMQQPMAYPTGMTFGQQGGMGGMNQGYGSPFGGGMGGYGSQFGGGFGQQMGGFNPYAQQGSMGGYGSPFGGGMGRMGGFNPYAQQGSMGGYGSPFGGGMGMRGSMFGGMGGIPGNSGFPDPMSRGGMRGGMGSMAQPAVMQQGPMPQGGFDSYGNQNMNQNMLQPAVMPSLGPNVYTPRQAENPQSIQQTMDSVGGLGGLAQLLRGRGMFNKGGKVDE